MHDFEQEDPIPQGDLALQITALPRETNGFGDIFGGWLVSQMDLAGTAMASKVAGGRVATVAIDRMAFLVPVAVGAQLSFYTQALEIGRSSIQMMVEVWSDDPLSSEWRKVTEAVFVFVAIDGREIVNVGRCLWQIRVGALQQWAACGITVFCHKAIAIKVIGKQGQITPC